MIQKLRFTINSNIKQIYWTRTLKSWYCTNMYRKKTSSFNLHNLFKTNNNQTTMDKPTTSINTSNVDASCHYAFIIPQTKSCHYSFVIRFVLCLSVCNEPDELRRYPVWASSSCLSALPFLLWWTCHDAALSEVLVTSM